MCHSQGIDDSYESIVWDAGSPLPSKELLDTWIEANPNMSFVDRHITVLAFRNRFTLAEKVAIELASQINPADPMQPCSSRSAPTAIGRISGCGRGAP